VVDLVYDEVRHGTLACKRWESMSAETRFRLRQQYRRTLTIQHPNLVRLFELFAEGDATCLTMEAVAGAEVRKHVQALGDESRIAIVLDVLHQLSDALMALHAAGIVHRDIKPSNVLVETSGRVVLLDGSFVWPRESHFQPLDEHTLVGTLAYLAPECLRGALPSVESDWYGFGALATELLTGRPAFAGSLDAMLRAKDGEPRALRELRPDVPAALDDLVCGLLERDPRMRPTGVQLFEELRELREAHPSSYPLTQAAQPMPPSAANDVEPAAVGAAQAEAVQCETVETAQLDFGAAPHADASETAQVITAEVTHAVSVEAAHADVSGAAKLEVGEGGDTDSLGSAQLDSVESAHADGVQTVAHFDVTESAQHGSIETAHGASGAAAQCDIAAIVDTGSIASVDFEFGGSAQPDAVDHAHAEAVASVDAIESAHTHPIGIAHTESRDGAQSGSIDADDTHANASEPAQLETIEASPADTIETAHLDPITAVRAAAVEFPPAPSPEPMPPIAANTPTQHIAPAEPFAQLETAPAAPLAAALVDAEEPVSVVSELRLIDRSATSPHTAQALVQPEPIQTLPMFDEVLAPRELEQALAPLDFVPAAASPNWPAGPALPRATAAESGVRALQLGTAQSAPDQPAPPPDVAPLSAAQSAQLARLETLLTGPARTQLVLLLGAASAGQTRLAVELAERTRQRADCLVFEARCAAKPDQPFNGFASLMSRFDAQLAGLPAEQREACAALREHPSLLRMFPHASGGTPPVPALEEAHDPQRRFIDALLAFRRLWLQLAETKRVLICLDDCQFLDRDALRLLQVLLCGEFSPKLTVLLACSRPTVPDWLMAKLERIQQDATLRSTRVDLRPDEDQPSPAARSAAQPDDSAAISGVDSNADPAGALAEARRASEALALELAADLYRRTLERHPESARQSLAEAAQAEQSAGRLEDAARSWLALARSSPDRTEAQRFELAAASALLHSGREQEGRALLESVLRDCGVRWPRLPWLTSTFERARVLLGPLLSAPVVGPRSEQVGRRFDALWAAAKEVVLLTPTAGDALSVHALREAVQLGDPSRLSWALGYEAALEANVGGPYMQRRARALEAQVTLLAEQSGQTFDAAYARSVQGVVAWFAGEWATAELALREALRLYDRSANASAHERHVLESFLVGALEAQGKHAELATLLVDLRIAAEQTGHAHALAMCRLAEASLPALLRDQPLAAIASADAALSSFANDDFTPLRFQHCVVTVSARLYAGHVSQAFQQIEQFWRRPGRAYFLRLDAVGIMLRQLRARAALAMTQHSAAADVERLRKLAAKEAAAIGSTASPHARGLEHVIRSSLASLAGSRELARQHCAQAIEAFDTADMALMREVARHQHAMLTNDLALRARELAQSGAFFRRAGVQNPAALTRAWFPVPAS
jgi:hypothetical protein